jgi:hypothetical protein
MYWLYLLLDRRYGNAHRKMLLEKVDGHCARVAEVQKEFHKLKNLVEERLAAKKVRGIHLAGRPGQTAVAQRGGDY